MMFRRETEEVAARVHELLEYDPVLGVLRWRAGAESFGNRRRGVTAGSRSNSNGYVHIRIDLVPYLAHRLAWLVQTGSWPTKTVDHRNGVRHDNRWDNLREATPVEQGQNIKKHVDNTSGFVGVSFDRTKGKWRAAIGVNLRQVFLGYFDTPEEASAAYLAAKAQHHTFQPSLRKP
jgi:hypothetical protein